MAKRKVKSKSKTKTRKRVNTMAVKKRKPRRKRRTTTTVRSTLAARPKRRRKKKSFLSAAPGGLMSAAKHGGAGAIGGGLFLGTRLVTMPLWARTSLGYAAAIALGMFNAPFVGAGMAGATTYHLGQSLLPVAMLHDEGEMEDADFVDQDTLSDTGAIDRNGNPVVIDDNGAAYALNDNNELEPMSSADLESVSMNKLSDEFDLSENPYNLSEAGYGY